MTQCLYPPGPVGETGLGLCRDRIGDALNGFLTVADCGWSPWLDSSANCDSEYFDSRFQVSIAQGT